jgi:hypothetical protein
VCSASIALREEIVIEADIRQSRLYSEDLAPVPASIQNQPAKPGQS